MGRGAWVVRKLQSYSVLCCRLHCSHGTCEECDEVWVETQICFLSRNISFQNRWIYPFKASLKSEGRRNNHLLLPLFPNFPFLLARSTDTYPLSCSVLHKYQFLCIITISPLSLGFPVLPLNFVDSLASCVLLLLLHITVPALSCYFPNSHLILSCLTQSSSNNYFSVSCMRLSYVNK